MLLVESSQSSTCIVIAKRMIGWHQPIKISTKFCHGKEKLREQAEEI
jgi:hypothetical protein